MRKISCYNQALRLLARRAHSVHELRGKLVIRQFPSDEIEEAIQKLLYYGYLDDAAYCQNYAAARVGRMRIGPSKLRQELARKGFDNDLVESVATRLFADGDDEISVALEAASKKAGTLAQDMDDDTMRRKIFDHLSRRGFSSETARRVVFDRLDEVKKWSR